MTPLVRPSADFDDEREMPLVGHLEELRARLIVCLAAVAVAALVSLPFAQWMLGVLIRPVQAAPLEPGQPEPLRIEVAPDGTLKIDYDYFIQHLDQLSSRRLAFRFPARTADGATTARAPQEWVFGPEPTQHAVFFSPIDPLLLTLKLALLMSVVLALPVILWQIWLFVKPGLTRSERAVVKPLLAWALVLFPLGAGFAYGVLRLVLALMLRYAVPGLEPMISVHSYLSLLFSMMLVFGFLFEMPLVVVLATRMGLVTPAVLRQYRRHAYVVLAFAAMVLTPADPFSMILMLIPLIGLFELSLVLAQPLARPSRTTTTAAELSAQETE